MLVFCEESRVVVQIARNYDFVAQTVKCEFSVSAILIHDTAADDISIHQCCELYVQ